MRLVEINVNYRIRVKLTELGKQVLRDKHAAFLREYPQLAKHYADGYDPTHPDDDGWYTSQMWQLMEDFGPHFSGVFNRMLFETTVQIEVPNG